MFPDGSASFWTFWRKWCLTRENQTSLEKLRMWQPQAFHETESIRAPGNCESWANPWEPLSSADFPWHFWAWRVALEYPLIHTRPSNDLLAEGEGELWALELRRWAWALATFFTAWETLTSSFCLWDSMFLSLKWITIPRASWGCSENQLWWYTWDALKTVKCCRE